jgi:hypothetical protein
VNTQIKPAYDGVIINSLQVVDAQTMAVSSEIPLLPAGASPVQEIWAHTEMSWSLSTLVRT